MGKKSRKHERLKDDAYDEFDDLFGDEFDVSDIAANTQGESWEEFEFDGEFTGDARRKTERRRDIKRLYSELDEWEEFGDRNAW